MTNIFSNSDLFITINKFTDLRSLCDTCSLFATLKKYIYYKLNKKYSSMYYNDILFKNRVLNKIFNPYKQLYLDLEENKNIVDVKLLEDVHTLNLSYCQNITSISVLGNVDILILRGCVIIRNVSALKNVNTLIGCGNITDDNAPRIVNTLDFGCINITYVRLLSKFNTFCLSYNENISTLRNIHTLDLNGCEHITDVSTLDLSGCENITDVSTLDLSL